MAEVAETEIHGSDAENSTTLEEKIRKFQEEFEQQVIQNDEDFECDSTLAKLKCEKNPGHDGFVLLTNFEEKHLPEEWRDPWVWQEIRRLSQTIVKLQVKKTSSERPHGYDCYKRPENYSRVATGYADPNEVRDALQKEPQPCPLENCPREGPHYVTPYFKVSTAIHVIFNATEANVTKVMFTDLLFEDGVKADMTVQAEVVSLDDSQTGIDIPDTDLRSVRCVCHDLDKCRTILEQLHLCAKNSLPKPKATGRKPMIVIISHPHGCEKHVSVGKWTGLTELRFRQENLKAPLNKVIDSVTANNDTSPQKTPSAAGEQSSEKTSLKDTLLDIALTKENLKEFSKTLLENESGSLTYSAATCSGSSGAPVIMFHEKDGFMEASKMSVHMRYKGEKNFSGLCNLDDPDLIEFAEGFGYNEKLREKKNSVMEMDLELD